MNPPAKVNFAVWAVVLAGFTLWAALARGEIGSGPAFQDPNVTDCSENGPGCTLTTLQGHEDPEPVPAIVGEHWDGICPVCKAEGRKSTVRCDGMVLCTSMYCGNGGYDENGLFDPPSRCNSCSGECRCSYGHEFVQSTASY